MTFRELALQDEANWADTEKSTFQSVVDNQSPIMKMWFVMMATNLLLFLFLFHTV